MAQGAPGEGIVAVGIDIGATNCRAAGFDADDQVIARQAVATPRGAGPIIAAVVDLVESVAATRPGIIAVGVPGQVDAGDGSVRRALNLGIDGRTPFGSDLAARLGQAVHVENDVNAAALGAATVLGVQPPRDLAYVSIGTGLAAGFVLGGRIHRGATGAAGEIGHLPVPSQGALCACGQRGCAERSGSGGAIDMRWGPTGAAGLWSAADEGDELAVRVRDDFVSAICSTIRLVVLTLDVDVVTLGGGVSQLGEPLLESVRGGLATGARYSPLLTDLALADRVRLLPAGVPVGELGAVLAARQAAVTVAVAG